MDINGPGDPIVIPSTPEPDAAPSTSLKVQPHQVLNERTSESEHDAQQYDKDWEILESPQEPSNPAVSQMIPTDTHQLQSMPALSTPATDLNTLDRASTLTELRSIPASSPAGNIEVNGSSNSQCETAASDQFAERKSGIESEFRGIMNCALPEDSSPAQLKMFREMQMRMATHCQEWSLEELKRDRCEHEARMRKSELSQSDGDPDPRAMEAIMESSTLCRRPDLQQVIEASQQATESYKSVIESLRRANQSHRLANKLAHEHGSQHEIKREYDHCYEEYDAEARRMEKYYVNIVSILNMMLQEVPVEDSKTSEQEYRLECQLLMEAAQENCRLVQILSNRIREKSPVTRHLIAMDREGVVLTQLWLEKSQEGRLDIGGLRNKIEKDMRLRDNHQSAARSSD